MNFDLSGKTAIITGGTRGIGRAIAELFAKNRADVAVAARNAQLLTETTNLLENLGINAYGEVVDVADGSALQAWVHNSNEALGGVDIVVANPSAFGIGTSEEDWRQGFNVDLMGTVRCVQTALPYLEKAADIKGDAAIITLSSAMASATDIDSAYGAYKAALINYTKGLARRLAGKKIRANSISPGTIYCENGFWENAKHNMPEVYEEFFNRNPMGRMGTPEEVANATAFLASPAASFITGTNMVVDGGFTDKVYF
ncbi:MAG: SDR family NAD(P)-dependent oxidoreductase [Gammaproteobacteria bacterium]|jgi:3-oxoacyl-[acyl-carrier protein] reductase